MAAKKNILIVHYNTPFLTECLVRSINHFVKGAFIYIFDNSDKEPFTAKFPNVRILDNTKGGIIDFDRFLSRFPDRMNTSATKNNFASAKHCMSIDKCMDIIGEGFVLLDSDVLLTRDITTLYREDYMFVGDTELWRARRLSGTHKPTPKSRAIPYVCYINTRMCRKHGVRYFDENRMYGLTVNGDTYDTGTYFLERIVVGKHPWLKIDHKSFVVHYKAGSWAEEARKNDGYVQVAEQKWLEKNRKYWDFGDDDKGRRKVVYTCITGGYDVIKEPTSVQDDFDYVCFTDDSSLISETWDIRPMPKESHGLSKVKSQRYVKLNPHKVLPEYDLSVWVDGNILIKGDINKLLSKYVSEECSVYVPKHPHRDCIYKEAEAVLKCGKDTKESVSAQVAMFREDGFPEGYGLPQTNIIIRKHNDEGCIRLMDKWFSILKNGSHRDQLSFNYALWKNDDVPVKYMDKKIYDSEWFKWNGGHRKLPPTKARSRQKRPMTREEKTYTYSIRFYDLM